MPTLDRLRSDWIDLRNTLTVYRHLPRLVPFARINPAKLMQEWAERIPEALAVAYLDDRYSWREANDRSNQHAQFFHGQGVGAGDVVAVMMDNRPDFLFAVMGLNKLGAIGALINTNVRDQALTHAIAVSKARKVLVGVEHLPQVLEIVGDLPGFRPDRDLWVQVEDEDTEVGGGTVINDEIKELPTRELGDFRTPRNDETFCYIYTSGTTGLPKAAIVTNQRMMAAAHAFGKVMVEGRPGDVVYVSLPLYHSSAMYIGWGSALSTGAAVALRRKFSAHNFWHDVRRFDATAFLYIGELCRYLLNTPPVEGEASHRLRVGVGNGLRPDIWKAFQQRFNVPLIREFYGATEGNAPVMNFEGRPGMVGRVRRGQVLVKCDVATGEVKRNAQGLCDPIGPGEVGLLLGRISRVMKFDGYVDQKATQKKVLKDVLKKGDEYFNTGDLIQLHPDGWLSFADRVGDTFRWKGENVSTNEVAEILNGAPGVLESNVYGVQVPHTEGRAGMAALTTGEGFDLGRFAAFVAEKLPGYMRPQFVRILGDGAMRITGTFKHQKVDYRTEGFDPSRVADALYLLRDGKYVAIDAGLYEKIYSGEVKVG